MVFEELYQSHWDKVYRLCMGYVNDEEWAKDIAQDTFVTVWQQLAAFRNESAIGTWIFRIACNKCLRQIEKNNRFKKKDLPLQLEDKPGRPVDEEVAFLYKCIAQLNETDRLIISLELEDVKQAEIAGILGISEANVRVRIHRIKEKLTQKFKSYER
ncbi:RNA polymerase sigma factor [Chitinophaga nivalis]|uniref:Sigma-70 family RNA polymerase sigma factor n=1 Tax=Chitinophaga nivalis TaxID=2991709 RepID=A0ABT3IJ86_9BACT|nr:sigma-70 family RNA polymerase sigma factor [Chitinophaga nivalis]MCW3466291.1 sigma-70 family RNA polymerase sigma factor [Chitinophaga nivalis]MCW3484018.1 sigma-70 family RNA polymerase sigma factor [Chitinophaga nivalis]